MLVLFNFDGEWFWLCDRLKGNEPFVLVALVIFADGATEPDGGVEFIGGAAAGVAIVFPAYGGYPILVDLFDDGSDAAPVKTVE